MGSAIRTALFVCLNAICAGVCVSWLILSFPAFFGRFNDIVYDFWLMHSEPKKAQNSPIIINMDGKSTEKVGQLPWPRTIIADLVNLLLENGAAAIGLDIWFTEPDRSSPIAVDGLLEKNFGLNLDFSNIPLQALDNDRYFRNAIFGKPVVLGGFASFSEDSHIPDLMPDGSQLKGNTDINAAMRQVPAATGFIPPIPALLTAAPAGLLNVSLEGDGIVRKIPLLVKVGDQIFPSLSLLTLQTAMNADHLDIETVNNELDALNIGSLRVPLEKDGSFRPLYHGKAGAMPYFSAVDVLDGKVGRKEIEGRIVFVGPSAQSLRNLLATPFDSAAPGAEIHATIVDNILAGENVRPPHHEKVILIFLIFFVSILGAIAFRLFPFYGYGLIFVLSLCILIGGSWLLFQRGIFLSPIAPVFALLVSALITLPIRFLIDQSEKLKLKQAFNHYVAPEIVTRIVNGGTSLFQGEYRNITIMFSDVRGFTEISEQLDPSQLVKLLNFYFTPMTACIKSRKGTMDKFIGDALMAFWNAPLDVRDHPHEAVMAALEMQESLANLRPEIMRNFGVRMCTGIGIHTGVAHIGNMGSKDLLDYTCIGENVNLASRLESLCKRYGMEIIVSSSVKDGCRDNLEFILLDHVKVKGSAKPIKIYAPLGKTLSLGKETVECWQEALNKYFQGNFAQAQSLFSGISEKGCLKIACQLFCARCQRFRQEPLSDWDGVWNYQEK